jgi:hypothetical protein
LAEAIRWHQRPPDDRLTTALLEIAWDIQTARSLGDEDWASELEPVHERLREAVLRRETALPLLVLGAI